MKLLRSLTLCCAFLGVGLTLAAQGTYYRFEQFPADVLLARSAATCVLQDRHGFLWIGTWSGLIRYDGYSVRQYKQGPDRHDGLQTNKINTLYEDQQGRLWVGTQNSGFYRYDASTDGFIQYRHKPADINSLSNDDVWAIFQDSYGLMWIGTENGLNLFDPATEQFQPFYHRPRDSASLSHNFVYTISETPDRTLWIGTEDALNRLQRHPNGQPQGFRRYSLAPAGDDQQEYNPHNYIYKVRPVASQPSTIWVGTKAGLKRVGPAADPAGALQVQNFPHRPGDANSLSHNHVVDMAEETGGALWVATLNGLNRLEPSQGRVRRFLAAEDDEGALSNNVIRTLYRDRSNVLWIGTEGGLNKLPLAATPFFTVLPEITANANDHTVSALASSADRSGLWLGTRGSGLQYLPLSGGRAQPGRARNYPLRTPYVSSTTGFISDLAVDSEGWLWITTLGSGVLRVRESELLARGNAQVDPRTYSVAAGLEHLADEHLMGVMPSATGDVWIGSWDIGLVRYDRRRNTFFRYAGTADFGVDLQAHPTIHLLETREGDDWILWVGTRGGGLLKLRYDSAADALYLLEQYRYISGADAAISNNYINCLFIDSQQRFWVATENGLNRFDPASGRFTHILERDGLVNGIVQAIQEDKQGRLWISTQNGISCLHLTPADPQPAVEVRNFDAYDGLQDIFFYDDAAARTRSGQLAFGGVRGVTIFAPEHVRPDTLAPQVALVDFRLFNRSVPIGRRDDGRVLLSRSITETKQLDLTYRDNVVSFEFVGLQFREPRKTRYAYQLQGFDADWIYTDATQRIAHYTNLPPGDYTFRVKAANGDGYWSAPVSVDLRVRPPFWLTGWAYALYVLLFIALLYGVRTLTRLRANYEHRLQLERLEREKTAELSQLKLQFFTNVSHELRTPLTLIISPLEQLVREQYAEKKLHRTLTRMYDNASRLMTMINQLLDFRKNEAGLMQLRVATGNIVRFMQEIVLSFRELARQRQIKLTFEPAADEIPLCYDRDQLEKVVYNLLSNAIRHTPAGGRIRVIVAPLKTDAGERIRLQVTDTGRGIPPDELERIFERFYQVEQGGEATSAGGTGIGLALAKNIVEAHHGQIRAESCPGEGASFIVDFLPGSDHFAASEKIANFQDSEQIGSYREAEVAKVPAATAATANDSNGSRPRLLIVEDNADIRAYLREHLEADYHIAEAADGHEGWELAQADPPDLVLADISMPRLDGIELCRRLKTNVNTSHVPVVLLTARTSLIFKIDGLETGADDYITKPFNLRLLSMRIRNLIESRRQLREKFSRSFDLSPSGVVMNSLDEDFLSRLKQIIEAHIDDSTFSVEQLATALHMSRMQLYRKLKALTGETPNKIIRSIRLKRAAQLLDTRQYNVADVTYMVGYNDLKSFREQFKKEFGVAPSGYEGDSHD